MIKIYEDSEEFFRFIENSRKNFDAAVVRAREIFRDLRTGGDGVLLECVRRFDAAPADTVERLKVGADEMKEAGGLVGRSFISSARKAAANIEEFHARQKRQFAGFTLRKNGFVAGEKILPLGTAGVYVPGGEAFYPSTVLMNVIPAIVAGVERVYASTPPRPDGRVNPETLAVLDMLGVREVYRVGGAHAVAAMALGGGGMPAADKIVGPGNKYVAAAKLVASQEANTGIDGVAGPTEIVIIADGGAVPGFAAADMLSQAEHGEDSLCVLIATSKELAESVLEELEKRVRALSRGKTIRKCLRANGAVLITGTVEEALKISDGLAPEHLSLQVDRPRELFHRVKNAGAVFLGDFTPESMGDYFAGPNHVLPTAGRARYASALGVYDFMKRVNFVYASREGLSAGARDITTIAESEGFDAHAEAVAARISGTAEPGKTGREKWSRGNLHVRGKPGKPI